MSFTMEPREPSISDIKPGVVLKHFKYWLGTEEQMLTNRYVYQVLHIAKDQKTGEPIMVYQGMYPPFQIWCRPLSEVFAPVNTHEYPRSTKKYKFEIVGELNGRLEL